MDPRSLQITTLTSGWRTGTDAEAQLISILRDVPQGELDAVLADLDVDQVIGDIDDHRWGPDHRTELLGLLLEERLGELSSATLATVLSALHRGPTPRSHQEAIVAVLTGRTGEEFHDLKYRLNSTGDHHDLEHLVFEDLDEDLRERLLAHFAEQAGVDPTSDLRVLCDIDDTVTCVIHDDRYPKGTVYPGIVDLLTALDHGTAEEPNRAGDLTFVTARPGGPSGLVEQYTRNKMSGLGLPPHSVLGGSFLNLHTKAAIAERKLQNMDRDRLLFPECRMVFIGDSGQADGDVGAQMHELDPQHIVGTLLHNVTDLDDAARQEWAARGVYVFDTYAGAAAHAVRLGLLRVDQAREVAQAVRLGLGAIDLTDEQRERLEGDLAADEAAIGTAGEAAAEAAGAGAGEATGAAAGEAAASEAP